MSISKPLIEKLRRQRFLDKKEWIELIQYRDEESIDFLFKMAQDIRDKQFGHGIFTRGLIEFTNYCKNDCFYCGIRHSNITLSRYRLSKEQILECCANGYKVGFRTFVLQGGEDPHFTDERMVDIVTMIKSNFPDCAITLSLGERSFDSYIRLYNAGANRYLLRHETAVEAHYQKLHPKHMRLEKRIECIYNLKKIGYQTGTGFLIGSPGQDISCLAEDMIFIRKLNPQMVGIGPFVPHHETPFADKSAGSVELTLFMIGLLRVMLPTALLPATTALGSIDTNGREKGILAGANVVMPNLSPVSVREKYQLYDNKIYTGDEAAEGWRGLNNRMQSIGYKLLVDRGDYKGDTVNV
jgi:biotin synthase